MAQFMCLDSMASEVKSSIELLRLRLLKVESRILYKISSLNLGD